MTAPEERDAGPYRIDGGDGTRLPFVVEAEKGGDVGELLDWLGSRADWVEERITRHGALLLRGFGIQSAKSFEAVARAVAGDLRNDYWGTPGNRLSDYVFPASDVPGQYAIASHCEMSYLRDPPPRLFFCCFVPATGGGGETPIADFRAVWRELDPAVRERFERGGIRVDRLLRGPDSGRLRFWTLVRWDQMFHTRDREEVEAQCRREGFEFEWVARDHLRLTITQPITRKHPRTGERVWFNQFVADHLTVGPAEYARIVQMNPSLRSWARWQQQRAIAALKRLAPRRSLASHCTYADGREVPDADMESLRDTIWRNTAFIPWKAGDVLAIDNRSIAHGRLPFRGTRRVVACLA